MNHHESSWIHKGAGLRDMWNSWNSPMFALFHPTMKHAALACFTPGPLSCDIIAPAATYQLRTSSTVGVLSTTNSFQPGTASYTLIYNTSTFQCQELGPAMHFAHSAANQRRPAQGERSLRPQSEQCKLLGALSSKSQVSVLVLLIYRTYGSYTIRPSVPYIVLWGMQIPKKRIK